jgi:outer membrane protein assembly factor BamD
MHNYYVFISGLKKFQYFCATFFGMKIRIIIFLIIGLLVSSCGEYEKILKSTDFDLKKNKAKEYFDEGQYARASELLQQILPRYKATEDAEELTWMGAQSYYGMKDYLLAGSEFRNFADLYPYGRHSEEANFLTALCDYYMSPRPELDQENTRNAIEGFTLFITRFPASPRVDEARKYITEMKERLVKKSYMSARLYYDMKQYKASAVALANSLKEYPETQYREEMMFLKLTSLFQYAELSIYSKQTERYQATLDDYYSFVEEFPKSSYSREIGRIYDTTTKKLKLTTVKPQTNN